MKLRSMLEAILRRPGGPIVPANPEHARTLARADTVLANPRIKRILSVRDREMKAAFARQGQRLAR